MQTDYYTIKHRAEDYVDAVEYVAAGEANRAAAAEALYAYVSPEEVDAYLDYGDTPQVRDEDRKQFNALLAYLDKADKILYSRLRYLDEKREDLEEVASVEEIHDIFNRPELYTNA